MEKQPATAGFSPPHLDLHRRRKSLRNTSACSSHPAQKLHTLILSTYRNCSTLNELRKKKKRASEMLLPVLPFSRGTSSSLVPSSLRSSQWWDDANLLFNSQLFLTSAWEQQEIRHPSNRLKRVRPSPLLPRWLISWNSSPPKNTAYHTLPLMWTLDFTSQYGHHLEMTHCKARFLPSPDVVIMRPDE